jgi:cytochrome c peroxidase
MVPFAATRVLFVLVVCNVAAVAQQAQPRFVLPEVPYDYAPLAAPGLERHFSLPGRDGRPEPRGCGGPPPEAAAAQRPPDRTNELATLGRVLFHDPLLSRNESRSCASCHEQARAFADGRARSSGFRGAPTRRNSMAITNLGWLEGGLFWDARAATLEKLVLMPIQDPIEMGLDLSTLETRLRTEPGYAPLFAAAFGDPSIDRERIARGLAQFVRSIVSLRSKYDDGLAATGDVDAEFPGFTAAENRGKKLFFGDRATRAQSCAACHTIRHRTGCCGHARVFDPLALQTDSCSNNGVDDGRASDDPGLGGVTGEAEDRGKFRAPSLRNIELTAPYMHDGRFATLDEVMQFYATRVRSHPNLHPVLRNDTGGGGWGDPVGSPAPSDATMRTVSPRQLGVALTRQDRADLVAFLKTPTDWQLVRDPRFADPFVRRRSQ